MSCHGLRGDGWPPSDNIILEMTLNAKDNCSYSACSAKDSWHILGIFVSEAQATFVLCLLWLQLVILQDAAATSILTAILHAHVG